MPGFVSRRPAARWEQACLEQPYFTGDEVVVPCRAAVQIQQRSVMVFARGKHRVFLHRVTVTSSTARLPPWGMRTGADPRGLRAQRPLWGHGLSCVSREWQTRQADRGAESFTHPCHSTALPVQPSSGAGAIFGAGGKHGERDCLNA